MRTRLILTVAIAAAFLLYSCGGQSSPVPTGTQLGSHSPIPVLSGPGMPAAAPDDFDISDGAHQASNTYVKFFSDSVNAQSVARWTVTDWSGNKSWWLSNTSNSAPKAWIMGGNYWNRSEDDLTSMLFNVPKDADGLRLTFYARWRTLAGDRCIVSWYDGVNWQLVHSFEDGQNPDYPGWTKYYYELPPNTSGSAQLCEVGLKFLSDTSGTDWGFGLDNVAVYQRQLEPPTGVTASDALPVIISVSWNLNDAGNLKPDFFDVYRSTTMGGPYTIQNSVPYPGTSYSDFPTPATTYYYIVRSRKLGYPDSVSSNEDSGVCF